MAELLILGHLLNRQRRDYRDEEDTADAVGLFVLLVLPALFLMLPYFVWVAARDGGASRFWSAWWVVAVACGLLVVGALAGPWRAVAMALAVSLGTVVFIAVRARRDRLAAEREGYYGR